MTTPTLTDYVAATRSCFEEFADLTAALSDEEWQIRSLCPDWSIRECVAHAIGIEQVLLGWTPSTEDPPPFDRVGPWMSESVELNGDDFNARCAELTASRLEELEGMDASIVTTPSLTPVGPQTYGDFLRIRVFDLWVHARDVAIPLDVAMPDGGAAASFALDEVQRSMCYSMVKKVGLEDGQSVTVHVTGGVERDIHVAVDGRAGLVDSLDDPSAELTADTETFIMLACGRVDPQARIDAGRITWTGDAEIGERAARNLRFTM